MSSKLVPGPVSTATTRRRRSRQRWIRRGRVRNACAANRLGERAQGQATVRSPRAMVATSRLPRTLTPLPRSPPGVPRASSRPVAIVESRPAATSAGRRRRAFPPGGSSPHPRLPAHPSGATHHPATAWPVSAGIPTLSRQSRDASRAPRQPCPLKGVRSTARGYSFSTTPRWMSPYKRLPAGRAAASVHRSVSRAGVRTTSIHRCRTR